MLFRETHTCKPDVIFKWDAHTTRYACYEPYFVWENGRLNIHEQMQIYVNVISSE